MTGMAMLLACETIIEIDPPDYDSELSISSKFSPDSVWAARITKTLPIGRVRDISDAFLKDATVMVYEGDVLIDQLTHDGGDDGWYVSSKRLLPQTDTQYRMVVEAPGLRSVSASSMIPLPPVVSNTEITKLDSDDPIREEYLVKFSLGSRAGLNYYSFSLFFASEEGESLPGISRYSLSSLGLYHDSRKWHCYYSDVLNPLASPFDQGFYCSIGILSDRSEQAIDFKIRTRRFLDESNGFAVDEVILIVNALSPEYVEYQGSIEDRDDSDGFGEPVNLYTNVEGGHGIFAGYSTVYRILDLSTE